jgi:diguanylate cyclase (GGDEF)-like protein
MLRLAWSVLLAGFVAYVVYASGALSGPTAEDVLGIWVYEGIVVGAAAICLLRAALIDRERLGWTLLGLALSAYAAAEIYYVIAIADSGEIPIPSPADVGYLLFYPIAFAGLIVLIRDQIGSFPAVRWLDGLIAGGAVAALAAALVLGPIVEDSVSGSTAAAATNLAYPIADLVLLALVVAVAALSGWRPGTAWLALGAGLAVTAISDVAYLFRSAQGTYVEDGVLDVAWLLGLLLMAAAAFLPPPLAGRGSPADRRTVLVPVLAALIAVEILFADRYFDVPAVAAVLSLLTLLGVILRLAVSYRETQRSLAASVHDSLTDPLTGLGNRRRFMRDLQLATGMAPGSGVRLLVLCDLDGFKAYNDAFGHPAGDALLRRLGAELERFATPRAAVYRLGGDEFCLLGRCTVAEVEEILEGATTALSERGDGFLVTAAQGSVLIPSEANTPESALQLADRRMYANKSRERASAGAQSRDVLMTAMHEREPALHEHLVGVAGLALRVAGEMRLRGEQRDEVYRAAELHDIGKMAIPDAILHKPGPLDEGEMDFMRQHTLIGERIIAAAPALVPVARLVRSSHERPDGRGYPDRLRGEEIPVGSRIIAVCDAYQAMTSERPHSPAMRPARALEELRRGTGSQFDPEVVTAFHRIISGDGATAAPVESG